MALWVGFKRRVVQSLLLHPFAILCIFSFILYPLFPSKIHVFGLLVLVPWSQWLLSASVLFTWSWVMHGCKRCPIEPFIHSFDACRNIELPSTYKPGRCHTSPLPSPTRKPRRQKKSRPWWRSGQCCHHLLLTEQGTAINCHQLTNFVKPARCHASPFPSPTRNSRRKPEKSRRRRWRRSSRECFAQWRIRIHKMTNWDMIHVTFQLHPISCNFNLVQDRTHGTPNLKLQDQFPLPSVSNFQGLILRFYIL